MAALSSSSSSITITTEEFNLFHAIDRELYSRLVFILGRDPTESMQVMAFWLWMEKEKHDYQLVKKMLHWPCSLLNQVANETVKCLKCAESDSYASSSRCNNEISLLQDMIIGRGISLYHFYENRFRVLHGVTRILNEVCVRAFQDLLGQSIRNNVCVPVPMASSDSTFLGNFKNIQLSGLYNNDLKNFPSYPTMGAFSHLGLGAGVNLPPGSSLDNHYGRSSMSDPVDFVGTQRQFLNKEIGEMLSRISLTVAEEEEKEIPPDDRTIFLTFSKGYRISEKEVGEFFTRRFGDIIEAIIMHEVPADEQALYARLVVFARFASIIDAIVGSKNKAKFSINGKHVWARKYVKKQLSKSPTRSKSPSPQPCSPVADPQQ